MSYGNKRESVNVRSYKQLPVQNNAMRSIQECVCAKEKAAKCAVSIEIYSSGFCFIR